MTGEDPELEFCGLSERCCVTVEEKWIVYRFQCVKSLYLTYAMPGRLPFHSAETSVTSVGIKDLYKNAIF